MLYLLGLPLTALNNMPQLAQLTGEHNASCFGWSLVSLDFNHDGYDDLVVFAAGYGYVYQQSPSRGKVYIYYGGPGFSSATEPAMTLEGDYPEGVQRAITEIINVGDVNGDGFDDLVVMDYVPHVSGSSRCMFYYGENNSLDAPDRIELPLPNESYIPYFKLGDVDGDGYDDIGIFYTIHSYPFFDIMWGGSFQRQTIHHLESSNMEFNGSIVGIGDIDNDGFKDFSIGYLGENSYSTIRIYRGNSDRVFTEYTLLHYTPYQTTRTCKPLGDLNGDGYDDFIGYANIHGIMVWLGTDVLEPASPDVVLNPVYIGNNYLDSLEAGDFNGDGYSDVVGASYNSRRFAVWMGSPSMNGHADWQKTSTLNKFGYDIAVGDFNGDGFDDIAVSAPMNEQGIAWEHQGYVFIYAGNAGMVANDDPQLLPPPQLSIRVFPNPLRREEIVQMEIKAATYPGEDQAILSIFNVRGQKVYQQENIPISGISTALPLNLHGLSNGVYLCHIAIGNMRSTTKFSIMK